MRFKSWFNLNETIYLQNNTATVFHRTRSMEDIQSMINGGYQPRQTRFSSMYGPGLYTVYELESTTNPNSSTIHYGDYVVKFKAKDLSKYLIFESQIAKIIHGKNWRIKDQVENVLKIQMPNQYWDWDRTQRASEREFTSDAALSFCKGQKPWEHKCEGIIYRGRRDGYCLLAYAPYKELQFLAYAYAPLPTTVEFIQNNWVKSSKDVTVKSISRYKHKGGLQKSDDKLMNKNYSLIPPNTEIKFEIKNLEDKIINKSLTNNDVCALLYHADDKDEIAKMLGRENVDKVTGDNVAILIGYTSDKHQIAEVLGSKNINKLTSTNVYNLLKYASDRYEMVQLLKSYYTGTNQEVISLLDQ
jgi:hypothetical protein